MEFSHTYKGVTQVKFIYSAIFIVALIICSSLPYFAQENEPVVIDEVVAQINDGVLTLSRINREMKELEKALVQQNKKTAEAAKAEIEGKKGEFIAGLIQEELLIQKGKELGVEQDVDAEINKRFLQIMKEQNIKTLEALYTSLRAQNYNVDEIRENWRREITKDLVLQREVDSRIYYGWTGNEIRKYWEANKVKFTKPEKVTLSEIFLNYAGRDENAVKAKAKDLVDQLRKGANFEQLVLANSDRDDVQQSKGKVGTFSVNELTEKLIGPIKGTKTEGYTDPIEVEGGIEILRIDSREEASQESVFDEDQVRRAMTYEKIPAERKKYIVDLKKDAYIEIAEAYRALILPYLNKDDATAEVTKTDK